MKRLSIGIRLALWYLAIFALGEFIFGAGMWMILRNNLYDLVDDGLESQVDDLKSFLASQPADASLAKLQQEVRGGYATGHAGDYLSLYNENHDVVFQSAFLQEHQFVLIPPDQVKRPIYRSRRLDGRPFRLLCQRISAGGHSYTVEFGGPADDEVETLNLFSSYLLIFAPILLLIAALVGFWLSRRALAPVDELVRTAREVTGSNLSGRVRKLETGDELQRLSDTLNEMLDRIEESFSHITQFTADASHELRTPVSLIRTEAELALRRSRGEAEYREALRHILLEAERTTKLIEQLLSLSRADSGRETLQMQPVDLRLMLQSVADAWQQVAAIRGLQFSATISVQDAFVMGDELLLRRVADILLDNACKYTASSGSVQLLLESEGESLIMTVRDSGAGIAREEHSKIFERFYRVDKARSRAEGGTGLGLAIAQWIVTQHRGVISVQSRLGEGSTFRVELPRSAAAVANLHPA